MYKRLLDLIVETLTAYPLGILQFLAERAK
jgi:hypothetical protein